MVTGDAADHYERLAVWFEGNWAYSPAFVAWMSGRIADQLGPHVGDRLIDVGCGTGLYSQVLAGRAGSAVCVDPSAAISPDQYPDQEIRAVTVLTGRYSGSQHPIGDLDMVTACELLATLTRLTSTA